MEWNSDLYSDILSATETDASSFSGKTKHHRSTYCLHWQRGVLGSMRRVVFFLKHMGCINSTDPCPRLWISGQRGKQDFWAAKSILWIMTTDTYYIFYYYWEFFVCFLFFGHALWHLVPWPGIKSMFLALEAWSVTHWNTREVPILFSNTSCFLCALPSFISRRITLPHFLSFLFWPWVKVIYLVFHSCIANANNL